MGWGALKSKLHKHALYAEQSKTTSMCNGTCIAPMTLLLTNAKTTPSTANTSSSLLTKLNYINFNSIKTIFITI